MSVRGHGAITTLLPVISRASAPFTSSGMPHRWDKKVMTAAPDARDEGGLDASGSPGRLRLILMEGDCVIK